MIRAQTSQELNMSEYAQLEPHQFRLLCREAKHTSHTSGACEEYAQANLIVLPQEYADDFINLCLRNPVPCPLLCKTPVGDPFKIDNPEYIKEGFDLRTDFPSYNVYENGELKFTKTDVKNEWSSNHIGFLIGCSHSFEHELCENGLTPRHLALGRGVPVYKTTKNLDPAGVFTDCTYVVSMRPYRPEDVPRVREITSKFKKTHGEPIDWGYEGAERLGITDLNRPDFGGQPVIHDDEIPVFWGCGVTPQLVVMQQKNKIRGQVISHTTGAMLVLDITSEQIKRLE
ncbi:hypothetical protein KL911_002987 [Ogataea haglerorum]|uniref:uncharacterized protein n=1 Tax=Ogataea haglerorum TaxID=1937702 RepID=UPI001C89FF29|nr:uncharacterized protein KL911_002987 [Ogataea haglerorum]KAG7695726.1 hypothetical protein KL951_003251 [Ogataea haglerorum]KAG7747214.1 hypothetical protein KL912_003238 [Ogataea haglerorum]KAG7752882.1 hypothetical protein KL911_002987 [Ogataea haglerorum]